jgi:hypothetical protein
MKRAWPKPSMGVSGLTEADHLIPSFPTQAWRRFKPGVTLGDLSDQPEVFLKLRSAKAELKDERKQLRSVQ